MRSYRQRIWTVVVVVSLMIFVHAVSFAQNEKIKGVQFKDGSILYGRVIETNVNDIRIETEDGKVVSRKFNDVDYFIKENDVNAKEVSPAGQTSSTFQIGFTYFNFDYKEDIDGPGKSTEYGWLPGVYFDYTFKRKSSVYAKVFLKYAAANITYDGSAESDEGDVYPLKDENQAAQMFKFETNIGYAIPIGRDFLIIPYLGYGYQWWKRGENRLIYMVSTDEFAASIEEVYRWHYIPVGIKAEYNITDKLNVAASAAANFMFYGEMAAKLSYIGGPDTDFTLGNRIGFYTEIPITYKFTRNMGISATPWYEHSAFGKSDVKYGAVYEPSSRTDKYGFNLGFFFSF